MIRSTLHEIIFEADTPAGKLFDVALLWSILLSVAAVLLESVAAVEATYGTQLRAVEWFFTILFTLEYVLRIFCSPRPRRYIFSFFGLIDLLAIIPTYLGLILTGSQYLLVVRVLRLLRVFRVLKMTRYLGEAEVLMAALKASRPKITVFLGTVLSLVVIIGAMIHLIEGPENGYTSIPRSMYWAIVTLTTVGYGDITPQTIAGQTLAAVVMILGYGIIAVPTGIVSVELSKAGDRVKTGNKSTTQNSASCNCDNLQHDSDASYCKICGAKLASNLP